MRPEHSSLIRNGFCSWCKGHYLPSHPTCLLGSTDAFAGPLPYGSLVSKPNTLQM